MKKYVFLSIISTFIGLGVVYAQEQNKDLSTTIDTTYVLIPSIEQSCKNNVFTDSMFRVWNNVSLENIKATFLKNPDEHLSWIMPKFIKGDNFRLSFCKVLNNDSLITKEDFRKGFFIVEKNNGDNGNYNRYLFIDKGKEFNMISYYFRITELTWHSSGVTIAISKNKFYKFYNRIGKQNRQDIISGEFIITKFTDEKIESFVFISEGCRKCIDQFYDLIGKYKIETK